LADVTFLLISDVLAFVELSLVGFPSVEDDDGLIVLAGGVLDLRLDRRDCG
jgi:hypothetical protein